MGSGAIGERERERFLDAVRTLAVLRVIVWHAFGVAAITYVLSAVPAMFFVTGSLLARSIDRHGAARTITDRLRRMLVPLWVFTAVAFAVMSAAHRISPSDVTAVPRDAILNWLFPLADPRGSTWEAGWLSSPLWYLRALLWMVLAAPLLLRLVRRAPWTTFGVLLAAVFALDVAARHPTWPMQQTRGPWLIGDFALYAIFVGLGFLHRDGRLTQLRRRTWTFAGLTAAGAAALWVFTQPVPRNVVNDSHPAHLLVGFAWLSLSLAASPAIERVAARRSVSAFINAMNSRSMSVYLWHSAAIIVGYQLLWRIPVALPYGLFSASLLALTAIGTFTLVTAFGWIEDLAARRASALWPALLARHPHRSGSVALAGLAVFALVGLGGVTLAPLDTAGSVKPPAPSQQPPTPTVTAGARRSDTAVALALAARSVSDTGLTGALTTLIDQWLTTTGVEGAQVAVMKDGRQVYAAALGTTAAGQKLGLADPFDTWSITKTYTASLVYRLVQDGRLNLDDPLAPITKLTALDTSGLTVRMLLDHSTGLVPYRDTAAYLANPTSITDAISALKGVLIEPRQFAPGTRHVYSSSNYLVLGLLVEQVTGASYDQLLHDWLLEPNGLDHTTHAAGLPGHPNFSTGGIITDIVDLVAWAQAYLVDHVGMSNALYETMTTTVDPTSALGAGVIGYCPCVANARGTIDFAAVGYGGSTTEIQFAAEDNTVIAINFTQSIWEPGSRYQDVVDLFGTIRAVVDAHTARG